jgi:ketosteroid isomerase-like protein
VRSQADQPPDELIDPVRRVIAAWNDDDLEAALEVADPAVELDFRGSETIFPGLDEIYRGHEGFRRWWLTIKEPFEYWHSEAVRFISGGDKVVAPVHFQAKGGTSGVEVELDLGDVWTVRDGLIVRFEAYATLDEALAAAGLREES